jgi:hypothetical protein
MEPLGMKVCFFIFPRNSWIGEVLDHSNVNVIRTTRPFTTDPDEVIGL